MCIALMNRSNPEIWNDTCRASAYYNSDNPYEWDVSELDFDTVQTYLQDSYKDTIFAKYVPDYGTPTTFTEFFGYDTPKTPEELYTVLNYCNYWYTGHQATALNGDLVIDDNDNLIWT